MASCQSLRFSWSVEERMCSHSAKTFLTLDLVKVPLMSDVSSTEVRLTRSEVVSEKDDVPVTSSRVMAEEISQTSFFRSILPRKVFGNLSSIAVQLRKPPIN